MTDIFPHAEFGQLRQPFDGGRARSTCMVVRVPVPDRIYSRTGLPYWVLTLLTVVSIISAESFLALWELRGLTRSAAAEAAA